MPKKKTPTARIKSRTTTATRKKTTRTSGAITKKKGTNMPNRREFDHINATYFKVEIEGVTSSAFSKVEGLRSSTAVVETMDGPDILVHKRPGRTRYHNIRLSRGFNNSSELYDWRKAVTDGRIERKAGSIIILDDTAQEIMRYNFFEAWPCDWQLSTMDAGENQALVEEIELVIEKIEKG